MFYDFLQSIKNIALLAELSIIKAIEKNVTKITYMDFKVSHFLLDIKLLNITLYTMNKVSKID